MTDELDSTFAEKIKAEKDGDDPEALKQVYLSAEYRTHFGLSVAREVENEMREHNGDPRSLLTETLIAKRAASHRSEIERCRVRKLEKRIAELEAKLAANTQTQTHGLSYRGVWRESATPYRAGI
ncbi:MAG TPA: hypothetical protein VGD49_01785 [Longimicrobiales bacterium]